MDCKQISEYGLYTNLSTVEINISILILMYINVFSFISGRNFLKYSCIQESVREIGRKVISVVPASKLLFSLWVLHSHDIISCTQLLLLNPQSTVLRTAVYFIAVIKIRNEREFRMLIKLQYLIRMHYLKHDQSPIDLNIHLGPNQCLDIRSPNPKLDA